MKQSKGILPVVASCVIVAALYAIVALAVPFERTGTYWVSFVFGWITIAVTIAASLFVVFTSRSMQSALYRVSVSAVSVAYLFVTGIANLAFMAFGAIPVWIVVVLNAVLLALCLIGFIGGASGAALVEADERRTQGQIAVVKDLRMQVDGIVQFAADEPTRKALVDLGEKLRYADPVSSQATEPLDRQLMATMAQINDAMRLGDGAAVRTACQHMTLYIDQRASVCRSTK